MFFTTLIDTCRRVVSVNMITVPSSEQIKKMPFHYYKREGRTFYFKNEYLDFHTDLHNKELYDFVDNYDIGDYVTFEM